MSSEDPLFKKKCLKWNCCEVCKCFFLFVCSGRMTSFNYYLLFFPHTPCLNEPNPNQHVSLGWGFILIEPKILDNYLAPLIFLLDAPLKFLISPFCLFFPLSHCLLPKPHHPPPLSQCAITSSTPKHTHTQICAPLFPPYHHHQRESSCCSCSCSTSYSLFVCLGNLCSLQGCLFVCVARSWFMEVVFAARIRFLLALCHFEWGKLFDI